MRKTYIIPTIKKRVEFTPCKMLCSSGDKDTPPTIDISETEKTEDIFSNRRSSGSSIWDNYKEE